MKIVDRKTFLSLPEETLFSKYKPCVFGDLSIKGESIGGNDFLYQQISDSVRCHDSGEFIDALFKSEDDGSSFSMDFDCQGRDGCFDEHQLFIVWEKADVDALIARLKVCASEIAFG